MLVYLDCDGTVLEHAYPGLGRVNLGWVEVVKKLQDAGHNVILNTYRADIGVVSLQEALHHINSNYWKMVKPETKLNLDFKLKQIFATKSKITPPKFDMEKFIQTGVMFIDDICEGTPLKPAVMTNGVMVDWDALDKIFQQYKIY